MKPKLWTRNFCLVTLASTLGSAGAIAGGFALSFLVFDETGSTLAAALIAAVGDERQEDLDITTLFLREI